MNTPALQLVDSAPPGAENRATSKPERYAEWLFESAGCWRKMMAFILIVGLTAISITFNVLLGHMTGADTLSKILLPTGFGMLDLALLFLCAYIALTFVSVFLRFLAFATFCILLTFSLWAAATFVLAIDTSAENRPLESKIAMQNKVVEDANESVDYWKAQVEGTENYKTKFTNTLNKEKEKRDLEQAELTNLESLLPRPTDQIYKMVAPEFGLHYEALRLYVRLAWAAAITLTPLIITILFVAEMNAKNKPFRPRRSVIEWIAEKTGNVSASFARGRYRASQNHRNVFKNSVPTATPLVSTETQKHRNTESRSETLETKTPIHVFDFEAEMQKRQEREREHIKQRQVEALRAQAAARKQADQLASELERVRALEQKRQAEDEARRALERDEYEKRLQEQNRQSDENARRAKEKAEREKRLQEQEHQAQKQELETFPKNTQKAPKKKRAPKPGMFDEDLFARIRHEVGSGAVKNTIRAIMAKYEIGYQKAKRYHSKLEELRRAI